MRESIKGVRGQRPLLSCSFPIWCRGILFQLNYRYDSRMKLTAMKLSGIAAGLMLALSCLPAGAEIHRCTAADGTLTFSDIPCGKKATTFRPFRQASTSGHVSGSDKRDRLLRALEEERRIARKEEAEARAVRMERAKKCLHARDQLRVVNEAGRIYNVSKNGTRIVQSDTVRTETMEKAQGYVDYWCD